MVAADFAGDALNDVLNEQGFLREGLAIDRQIQIEFFLVLSLNELPEVALLFGLGLNPFFVNRRGLSRVVNQVGLVKEPVKMRAIPRVDHDRRFGQLGLFDSLQDLIDGNMIDVSPNGFCAANLPSQVVIIRSPPRADAKKLIRSFFFGSFAYRL
ncbi:MAG TPA: hypothetical protein VGJ26_07460, partial [Pirellulales bacterium]